MQVKVMLMKHLKSLLAALIVGALVLAGAPPTAAVSPSLDRGPVTVFDVVIDDGLPALQVRDATGIASRYVEQRDPADVVLNEDGSGSLELAWSTESLPDRGDTVVGLELRANGPGHVQIGAGGDDGLYQVWDSSSDPEQPLVLDAGSTSDVSWSFTADGRYEIVVLASWYTNDGVIRGEPATYTIDVTQVRNDLDTTSGQSAQTAGATGDRCVDSAVVNAIPVAEVVDDGHFDFGVQVEGGALVSLVKDDRPYPATWRDPAELLFRLDGPALRQVPQNPDFDFLGDVGADVWLVGQSQEAGVPWLGWNTQHPSAREHIDGSTTWALDKIEGPGDVFVYQNESGEVKKLLGTTNDWPTELVIPANVHAHGNWAFTEPGVYRVHTTHTATVGSGGEVSSNGTLTFLVGDCYEAPDRPSAPLDGDRLLSAEDLTDDNRHGVTVDPDDVEVGDRVSVTVPQAGVDDWVMPVVYSEPQQTEWRFAREGGELSWAVTIPPVDEGEHKIAAYAADGELLGWTPLTVGEADDDTPHPGGDDDDTRPGGGTTPPSDGGGAPSSPGDGVAGDEGGSPRPEVGSRVSAPGGGASARTLVEDPCVDVDGSDSGGSGGADSTGSGASGSFDGTATTVTEGHFDFGAIIEGDQLVPRVKDDRSNPPEWVHPESLVFALGSTAEQTVPEGASYSFLGSPGETVWMIPQTQVSGVPWLGWNTQHETVRSNVDGQVTFTLDDVDGPGELLIYLTDSFGGVGERILGTAGGFPSTFRVPLNVHAHGNWAFTEPGSYRVTITQSATLNSGQTVSAAGTLVFEIGGPTTAPSGASARQSGGFALVSNILRQDDEVDGPRLRADLPDPNAADDGDGSGDTDGNGGSGDDDNDNSGGAGSATKNDCLPGTGASDDVLQMLLYSVLLMCVGVAVVAASTRRTFRPVSA